MDEPAQIIANCVEHDYNRTFHDTAVCVLGDLKRHGYAVVPVAMLREAGDYIDGSAGSQFSHDLAADLLAAATPTT